jgi:hypothetical protein
MPLYQITVQAPMATAARLPARHAPGRNGTILGAPHVRVDLDFLHLVQRAGATGKKEDTRNQRHQLGGDTARGQKIARQRGCRCEHRNANLHEFDHHAGHSYHAI